MVEFFRDVLSGPLYIVTSILSIIFIMAIIGFMMERKKLEKEQNEQIAHINRQQVPQNNIDTNPTMEELTETVAETMVDDQIFISNNIDNTQNIQIPNEEVVESILNIEVPNTDISVENSNEQVEEFQPVNNKQFIIFTDPDQKEE